MANLLIKKDGYYYVDDKGSSLLKDNQIVMLLNEPLELDDGITISHIIDPIKTNSILAIIYDRLYWNEIIEEMNNNHVIEPNIPEIKSVIICKSIEISELEPPLDGVNEYWDINGIGHDGEHYALDFINPALLMNFPIKNIGLSVYHNKKSESFKQHTLTKNVECVLTLNDLLYCIFNEFSFYGSPSDREHQKEILESRIKDIENGIGSPYTFKENHDDQS